MKQNLRDVLINNVHEKLKNQFNFFGDKMQTYENGPLKKVVTKLDVLLNQFLRDYEKKSINGYVEFIQSFTMPNKFNTSPLISIDLKAIKSQKNEKSKASVGFSPELPKVQEFILDGVTKMMNEIIEINALEPDIVPF